MTSAPPLATDSAASFGALLRERRLAAGLTQEALAERAGLSARAVSDLERGARQTPYPHTVRQLARALRLPTAERARLEAASTRRNGGPSTAPPDQDLPTNLPATLTSFVGREAEPAEVGRRLDAARLVTLTGAGGVGKTRLALEAARAARADYSDGVWLVELAALTDPALAARAVARALRTPERHGLAPAEALADWLADKRLLLVLDNCEHLVDACATLVERLLLAASGLRVLATSREPLGVSGEQVWPVPPLAVPADGPLPSVEHLGRVTAVRLFVERAGLAAPSFALTERNATAVASICRRLDGLPLAIELAAARVAALPPTELAARLDDRFALLTGGVRTAPPRQQTLQATLDWSWDLLAPEERQLLRQLAVFASGFTLEAAEAVCEGVRGSEGDREPDQGASPSPPHPLSLSPSLPHSVLDVLARLVEKSLVQVEEQGETARYRLLETVRQYGWRRLREAGETATAQRRHAAWCLALAEAAEPALGAHDQLHYLARLDAEHDNLQDALGWLLVHDPSVGLRLANHLTPFWQLRCAFLTGEGWLTRLLERAPEATAHRARALFGAGLLAFECGEFDAAQARYEQALALGRAVSDAWCSALALYGLGRVYHQRSDLAQSRQLLSEGLALARSVGDPLALYAALGWSQWAQPIEEVVPLARRRGDRALLGHLLWYKGMSAQARGEQALAQALFEEGLAAAEAIGARRQITHLRMELGLAAYARGDLDRAHAWFADTLTAAREVDDRLLIAWARWGLGRVAARQGDLATAAAALDESLALWTRFGKQMGIGVAHQALGELAWARGEVGDARDHLRASLAVWQAGGGGERYSRGRTAECLELLAAVTTGSASGRHRAAPRRAARLLASVEAWRAANEAPRAPIDRPIFEATVQATRTALGTAAFAAAWAEGQELTLAEAMNEGLSDDDATPAPVVPAQRDPAGLTRREVEVLGLLGAGRSNRAIAAELALSVRTVERHVANLYGKIDATNRADAAAYAIRRGLA